MYVINSLYYSGIAARALLCVFVITMTDFNKCTATAQIYRCGYNHFQIALTTAKYESCQ